MYSDVAQWAGIRRQVLEQGIPVRRVVRETGISRKTVRKMLLHPLPVPYKTEGRASTKLGPYTVLIQRLLQENSILPRSARLSVLTIFKRLRDEEGFTGTYRTVLRYAHSSAPRSVSR